MPIINIDTFEQSKKVLNLTNKAIADAARITETTVGRIKYNKNLQARSVAEIAKTLKLTTEQLTSPPEPTSGKGWFTKFGSNYLSAASIMYNVPENWIVDHAGLFFTLLAEQSLDRRSEKAKQCLADFEALDKTLLMRDRYFEPDSASGDHLDAIHRELQAIQRKDLSGPRDETRDQNAHFINFLCELEHTTTADFEMENAEEWDAETQTYIEQGVDIDNLSYDLGVKFDAKWKLLPDEEDPDQHIARNIIEENYILSKIPNKLRSPDRADDLVKWVLKWQENTVDKLLPEHPKKDVNDRRVLAKSIMKKYNRGFWLMAWDAGSEQPDDIANYVIQLHEKGVPDGSRKELDLEESSDA
tara:strand:+ start:275 stop:1348 length:1074 start_codon:yes stop_codon:yes gene_type:complete